MHSLTIFCFSLLVLPLPAQHPRENSSSIFFSEIPNLFFFSPQTSKTVSTSDLEASIGDGAAQERDEARDLDAAQVPVPDTAIPLVLL